MEHWGSRADGCGDCFVLKEAWLSSLAYCFGGVRGCFKGTLGVLKCEGSSPPVWLFQAVSVGEAWNQVKERWGVGTEGGRWRQRKPPSCPGREKRSPPHCQVGGGGGRQGRGSPGNCQVSGDFSLLCSLRLPAALALLPARQPLLIMPRLRAPARPIPPRLSSLYPSASLPPSPPLPSFLQMGVNMGLYVLSITRM